MYAPGSWPVAKNGMLDLREWSFKDDGFVGLNGEWEFYWNKLIPPEQILRSEPKTYHTIPRSWNKKQKNGKSYPVYGYGTYRLKIHINEPGIYAVYVPEIHMAHKLWFNNNLVGSNGVVAVNEDQEKRQIINYVSDFNLTEGIHTITLQISNHEFKDSGIRLPIYFGEQHQIFAFRELKISIGSLVFGCILFMIITHSFLYILNRKDWSNLLFVVLCICSFIYLYLRGERYLLGFFPNLEWDFYSKFLFVAAYSYVPVLFLFNHYLYPGVTSKRIRVAVKIVWVALVISVIIFPISVYLKFLPFYELLVFPTFLYLVLKSQRAFSKRKKGGLVALFGLTILVVGIVIEVLFENQILSVSILVPCYLGFLLTQSFLTSIKSAQAYKALEKSRAEISSQNIELNRLNSVKDEFLSNTTHELKTPLHGIMGIADALKGGIAGELNAKVKSNLSIIINSAQRLSILVNDILDAQRLRNQDVELNLSNFDLNQVTSVVTSVSQPLLKDKPVTLINSVNPETFYVHADSNRLYQIIQNLVSNACKFTESGSIEISAKNKDGMVYIAVTDTGIGISKEDQKRIFKRFEQVEHMITGSGLGLSISKSLVELHGGTTFLESSPGKGSHFGFTVQPGSISVQNEALEVPKLIGSLDEAQVISEIAPELQGQKILVVDDEPINLKVISDYLTMSNYKVHQCSSGQGAINYLKDHTPDLVLLDVMMPEIDGFSVCKEIRNKYSHFEMPVIFLTAKNQVTDLVQGFSYGANDYLTKPFTKAELLARVRCQLAISKAKDRLVNLREFANKISLFKNVDKLLKELFKYIIDDPSVDSAALFYNEKLADCTHPNSEKFVEVHSKWNTIDYHFNEGDDSFVFLRFTEIKHCVIVIKIKTVSTPVDIEYFRTLEIQAGTIVKNLQNFINDKSFLEDLYIINSVKKYIRFIKRENRQTLLFEDQNDKTIYLKSSLKTIECLFSKDLIRVNRFCLINPKKVMWINQYPDKKSKIGAYEINVDGETISLSKNHIKDLPPKLKNGFLKQTKN